MTGLEEKIIAGTVIKATDNVVKLFFAPQIEGLKKFLHKRYTKTLISDDNIEKLFNAYLLALYQKCSYITTIVFPQENILIEKVYEPLILENKTINFFKDDKEDKNKYFEKLVHGDLKKNIIIIDRAGMGKSTFSKYLILKILKNRMFKKIPIFVELRKINIDQSLLEFILVELQRNFEKNFTEVMLRMLMRVGAFIFILDGFDESSRDRQSKLGEEIYKYSFEYASNQYILTSRDQSYTPTFIDSITLNFIPLTLEQIKSLVLKYDDYKGLDVGKRLITHANYSTPKVKTTISKI